MDLVERLSNPRSEALFQGLTNQDWKQEVPNRLPNAAPNGRRRFGTVRDAIIRVLEDAGCELRVREIHETGGEDPRPGLPASHTTVRVLRAVRLSLARASACELTDCGSSPERDPAVTVWGQMVIYIDQSRWVGLLRAREQRVSTSGTEQALEAVTAAVHAGRALVPLSVAHYQETWNAHDWRRRHALAGLMRDVCQYRTIAPIQTVTSLEVRAALSGGSVEMTSILGQGANHAFDSATGRFIVVEELRGALYPTREIEGVPPMFAFLQEDPPAWEWLNLAGPPEDFPLIGFAPGQGLEFRPEHARGDDWVANELDLRERLDRANIGDRLHDALVQESLLAMPGDIREAARAHGPDLVKVLESFGTPREFHDKLPCRSVLVDLQYFRLSESQYRPHQHDRPDLLVHAVAFAYCDVVVTERRLRDLARRARITERFGTVVIQDLAELPAVLAKAA